MSLDIYVGILPLCPHCGHELDGDDEQLVDTNITYNVAPVYHRVMRAAGIRDGFRGLDGMTIAEAMPHVERALEFYDRHEDKLSRLWEGSDRYNGWGKTSCVRRVLRDIQSAADHPEARIRVL